MASALRLMLALLLCSIAALAAQPPDVLKQADSDFCQATRAKGLDGWMSWFADNGSLPQMTPPVQGKAALRAFYQSLFDHKDLEFRWAPDHAELFPAGNLGYTSDGTLCRSPARTANASRAPAAISPYGKSRATTAGKCSPTSAHPTQPRPASVASTLVRDDPGSPQSSFRSVRESDGTTELVCYNGHGADSALQPVRRGVAQPGRAPGSGPGGRRFKSSLPDHLIPSGSID